MKKILMVFLIALSSAAFGQSATAERNQGGGSDGGEYASKVHACILPGVSFSPPPRTDGNPAAQYRVSLKPDGQISDVRLTKSSGNNNFDRAIETGILGCTTFPRPHPGAYPAYIDVNYNMYNGESAPATSSSISFPPTGQGSQLSQLDGTWFSPDSNYGYILTNGIGIATQTNSPKFKVGDKIIELQPLGNNSFQGNQIYQNGKFYPILTTLISGNRMLVQGEHSVAWYMDRVRGTTYTPQTPLAPPPWNLNGSKMTVTIINGILNIYFIEPSKELVTAGARSDSLLLSGTVSGELVQGNAKLYVQKCGVFTYPVSGRLSTQQTRLELSGIAPVVNRQTCAISTTERQSFTLQTEQQTLKQVSVTFENTSQLSQLDGDWYSDKWNYGYTLTNGVGVATSTNSPNFKVGDRIIFLQQSSDKTFEGTQVYTDGKFYKITVQQQSNDTLLFKGEKNVSWTMTKNTQTTAQQRELDEQRLKQEAEARRVEAVMRTIRAIEQIRTPYKRPQLNTTD